MCAADFDDPLSEISSTITHVRSLSAGNVISDPTKLGSSFMRAPAAREYTPGGCCCSVKEEDLVRSLEDRSRNVTRSVGFGMAGITEKYSVGFAWKPRHGVPHAGTRLPINKLRHFARDSRVLSSHSARCWGWGYFRSSRSNRCPLSAYTAALVESSFARETKTT